MMFFLRPLVIGVIVIFCVASLVGYVQFQKGPMVSEGIIAHMLDSCSAASGDAFCMRRGLSRLIRPSTVNIAMKAIEKYYDVTPTHRSSACHAVGHMVGEIAASHDASLDSIIRACDGMCDYGCAHGAVVGFFKKDPTVINRLDSVCTGKEFSFDSPKQDACAHGMGHGIAEYTSLGTSLGLSYCEGFSLLSAKEDCWSGFFMETYSSGMTTKDKNNAPHNPMELCASVDPRAKNICLRELAASVFKQTHNATEALTLCLAISSEARFSCAETIGFTAYFAGKDDDFASSVCASVPELTSHCMTGSLKASQERGHDSIE
jgi:hypothetical protein